MPLITSGTVIPRMTRLQIYRLHKGWTRYGLAYRSGISVQTIEKHEEGIRNGYMIQTIAELIGALGVEQNDLVRGNCDIWEGDGKVWCRRYGGWDEIRISRTIRSAYTTDWSSPITTSTSRNWTIQISH